MGTVFIVLVARPILADPPPMSFSVSIISQTESAREPVISYAPNGTVWVSGTKLQTEDGKLWYALSDAGSFNREEDPPTYGGGDATVHHDLAGHLYFVEVGPQTSLGRRDGTSWHTQNLETTDRPWWRTLSTDKTVVAMKNGTQLRTEIWTWDVKDGLPGFYLWDGNASSASLSDFANDTVDNLYMLGSPGSDSQFILRFGTGPGAWTTSPVVQMADRPHSLPRLAVDLAGNPYAITNEKQSGVESGVALRFLDKVTREWSSPTNLCPSGKSCGYVGAAAGKAGRIGVSWYEATGNFAPNAAPTGTQWNFTYNLVDQAHSSPTVLERIVVGEKVAQGPLSTAHVGDFTSVERRRGDADGKVAVAFVCQSGAVGLSCPSGLYTPGFGIQTAGRGLLAP